MQKRSLRGCWPLACFLVYAAAERPSLHSLTVCVDEILCLDHLAHSLSVHAVSEENADCQQDNDDDHNIRSVQNSSSFIKACKTECSTDIFSRQIILPSFFHLGKGNS